MTTKQSRRHKLLATWPRMTSPVEHMGDIGDLSPHQILAGILIYSNKGGQNIPAKKACPHFFRKCSARPRMKCNIYYVCYYEYYKPQYNGPNLLSFSLQYISYEFLYKNQIFSNSPKNSSSGFTMAINVR